MVCLGELPCLFALARLSVCVCTHSLLEHHIFWSMLGLGSGALVSNIHVLLATKTYSLLDCECYACQIVCRAWGGGNQNQQLVHASMNVIEHFKHLKWPHVNHVVFFKPWQIVP